jgi:hypothetical protein
MFINIPAAAQPAVWSYIDAFLHERCTTQSDDLTVKPLRILKVDMLSQWQTWINEQPGSYIYGGGKHHLKSLMAERGFLDKQVLHDGKRSYCFIGLRLITPEERREAAANMEIQQRVLLSFDPAAAPAFVQSPGVTTPS